MKFSISTSFYKRAHLVENLYQQILNQTHTDWEWIVTDDFSEENNAEDILKTICEVDSRVKYYQQSRKKECFYNPQRGTTGDIVVQFDSDDFAYPRLLEIYNELFLKHPDVAGISCLSHTVDANGGWIEVQGGGSYEPENQSKFSITPMGRAWRNIIHSFDEGELNYYQNDTNIVRYVETKGKWLYLPRVLYKYYYSFDTFSRMPGRSEEEFAKIEAERLFIESKFPELNTPDKLSLSLYYLPIQNQSRDFSMADFNLSTTRKNILYIKEGIKVYEKQLLKELFYDHDLYFDYNLALKFDEIIISLNVETLDKLQDIKNILVESNKDTFVKMRFDTRINYDKNVHETLNNVFGGFGWCHTGYESFFNTAV
jgi:glycosyltransferase involved in cell wall biosynthesis